MRKRTTKQDAIKTSVTENSDDDVFLEIILRLYS